VEGYDGGRVACTDQEIVGVNLTSGREAALW
jgi:hypothetical protein